MYSPKIRVILPQYACHSDQVILDWLAVLLTVNLIKILNLSKLKRWWVMWGPAYRFELRSNSVVVRPLNSTWCWGLAAFECLGFLFSIAFESFLVIYVCTILIYGWNLMQAMMPWSLFVNIHCFVNPVWLWTIIRQCMMIICLESCTLKIWDAIHCFLRRCKPAVWINCTERCALALGCYPYFIWHGERQYT